MFILDSRVLKSMIKWAKIKIQSSVFINPNFMHTFAHHKSTKKYYRTGRKKLWRLFMMKGWADNNFEK
jgi:hypothetical protein